MPTLKLTNIPVNVRTPLGALVTRLYKANSNHVRKNERKGKVIWSGGTKVGSFSKHD